MLKHCLKFLLLMIAIALPLRATGIQNSPQQPAAVIILGGGIGALTSAIYLERAGVHAIVIEGNNPGGALAQSPQVQNWPGEIEIDGQALIDKIRHQAEVNGAEILSQEATAVDFSKRPFKITTRDLTDKEKTHTIIASSCIIATGSTPKLLGVPGENRYWTRGVYNCATCDGALYKDKTVVVAGGGDTAILEAEYLSKIAKKVLIVVRKNDFRTTETLRREILLKKSNVEVLFNTEIELIQGNDLKATHLVLNSAGNKKTIKMDALFLAIGSMPNTNLFKDQIQTDKNGYIVLTDGQATSKKGVFAIGDAVDPIFKQAISAAGSGACAALQAERELGAFAPVSLPKKEALVVNETIPAVPVVNSDSVVPVANSDSVIELSTIGQFDDELQSSQTPILVDFYSPYCGPCRKLSPLFEQSAGAYKGKIKFIKINVSEHSQLASQYNVFGVPTVIVFKQGVEVDRKTGLEEIGPLLKSLDQLLN